MYPLFWLFASFVVSLLSRGSWFAAGITQKTHKTLVESQQTKGLSGSAGCHSVSNKQSVQVNNPQKTAQYYLLFITCKRRQAQSQSCNSQPEVNGPKYVRRGWSRNQQPSPTPACAAVRAHGSGRVLLEFVLFTPSMYVYRLTEVQPATGACAVSHPHHIVSHLAVYCWAPCICQNR